MVTTAATKARARDAAFQTHTRLVEPCITLSAGSMSSGVVMKFGWFLAFVGGLGAGTPNRARSWKLFTTGCCNVEDKRAHGAVFQKVPWSIEYTHGHGPFLLYILNSHGSPPQHHTLRGEEIPCELGVTDVKDDFIPAGQV